MAELTIRQCHNNDLDTLTAFNRQLIEDEGHDNDLGIKQLKDRMKTFINTDYIAFLFEVGSAPAGYALVCTKQKPYYLRHFFIGREFRRMGYGRKAFYSMLRNLNTDAMDVEVLCSNERGLGFWRALGFKERSLYMKYGERK